MVLNIRVLTPDRVICSTTADEVVLPGLTGQVGVLEGHAALITALDTGLLRIKLDDKWKMCSKFTTYLLLISMFSTILGEKTEQDLFKELFKNYNKNVRPVIAVSIFNGR